MRIALFSDVHGNLAALEAVLAALPGHGRIDATVCAGDMVYLGSAPAEVLDRLTAAGVQMIRGNSDDLATGLLPPEAEAPPDRPHILELHRQHVAWNQAQLGPERLELLRRLPLTRYFSPAPAERLLICHATPRDNTPMYPRLEGYTQKELRQVYAGEGVRAVAFGHVHQPAAALLGDLSLINVSAVSIPADGQALAGYTIAEWNDDYWVFRQYRVPYDLAPEVARIRERGMPRPPWPKLA